VRMRTVGILAALAAAFSAGIGAGVEYAKRHYVARDRKFIEGKIIDKED
jgi:hypothetical protein